MRFETFCYGPRSCTLYKAGAPRKMPGRKVPGRKVPGRKVPGRKVPGRKVPGRKGMTWVEEETTHRGPDE